MLTGGVDVLRNTHIVTAVRVPKLSTLTLPTSFVELKKVTVENASLLEKHPMIERKVKEQEAGGSGVIDVITVPGSEVVVVKRNEQEILERREKGIVMDAEDYKNLPVEVTSITVESCEDYKSEVLDFSRFKELIVLKIKPKCFSYPSVVKIDGLPKLKSIEIGENCFSSNSANSQLLVTDCPALDSLNIGNHSFSDFKTFSISNNPLLRSLTMGSFCFTEAEFALKGLGGMEMICLGEKCFEKSRHTLIEGAMCGMGVMVRLSCSV